MDTRKLKHDNQKVIKDIIDNNKKVRENGIRRISDQQDIVLKDTLKHLEKKLPINMSDANKKAQDVIDYYQPSWRIDESNSSSKFFFSSRLTEEEEIEHKRILEKIDKLPPKEKARAMFSVRV